MTAGPHTPGMPTDWNENIVIAELMTNRARGVRQIFAQLAERGARTDGRWRPGRDERRPHSS